MSDIDGIHSCSYYCQHPKCIERQRDDLRDMYVTRDHFRDVKEMIEEAKKTAYSAGVSDGIVAEREACAKVCEAEYASYDEFDRERDGALFCADAIRARGE